MSRYPSTQFISIDRSEVTASVPISPVLSTAPTYCYAFRSPKGPEEITKTNGQNFYDLYGEQSKIMFNKYGQPLLQASMNVNNGANIIAKRAVLDSAKLANLTFSIALGYHAREVLFTNNENYINDNNAVIRKKFSFKNENGNYMYSIAPMVMSIKDGCNVASSDLAESKDLYTHHKNFIVNKVLRSHNFNPYFNASYDPATNTSNYNAENIDRIGISWDKSRSSARYYLNGFGKSNNTPEYLFFGPKAGSDPIECAIKNLISPVAPAPNAGVIDPNYTIERDKLLADLIGSRDNPRINLRYENDELVIEFVDENVTPDQVPDGIYENIVKRIQQALTSIYPIFTIVDNGRGVSEKSVSFNFDPNSTRTMGKPIYTLNIVNDTTGKTYESFYFTINPYIRNAATGFTFDIESAINGVSKQVKVVNHYDVYDALVNRLTDLGFAENILDMYDCIFKHDLRGSRIKGDMIPVTSTTASLYFSSNIDYNNFTDIINPKPTSNANYDANPEIVFSYINYLDMAFSTNTYKLNYGFDGELDTTTSGYTQETITSEYNKAEYRNMEQPIETVREQDDWVDLYIAKPDTDAPIESEDTLGNKHVYLTQIKFDAIIDGKYNYICRDIVRNYDIDTLYQQQYYKFFIGAFDRDIFNVDTLYPTAIFDCNYSKDVKIAIQRLAVIRGDFIAYMDMGINVVGSYRDVMNLIEGNDVDDDLPTSYKEGSPLYLADMHVAVTCLSYDIKDPYTNKQISVTGTYGLSNVMINHAINGIGDVFAGTGNGVIIPNAIPSSVNYIPKIYPTTNLTSKGQINTTYISDTDAITNEPQMLCDAKVNYPAFHNTTLAIETEFTLYPKNSEYSYINNVMLINELMQAIRQECPSSRYNFIDGQGLQIYQNTVESVLKRYRPNFSSLTFKYLQDSTALQNKIFYAAIEVSFRPFAQAEIFTITALNYSVSNSEV